MGDFPKLLLAVLCPECEGIDRREAWNAVCRHPLYMSLLCADIPVHELAGSFLCPFVFAAADSFSLH